MTNHASSLYAKPLETAPTQCFGEHITHIFASWDIDDFAIASFLTMFFDEVLADQDVLGATIIFKVSEVGDSGLTIRGDS